MADTLRKAERKTPAEVRQGVTGHKVRYVLGISLTLVVVAFAVIWLAFFR